VRVYKYGARPADNDIRHQMRLGRDYYNQLVKAENARRQATWGGERPPVPPHDDCRCTVCKAHWKGVRASMREIPLLDFNLQRASRPAGLYWGTYLLIEQAFAAAWKSTDPLHLVRYRSWRQGDVVGAQIQAKSSPDRLFRIEQAPDPRTGRRARNGLGRHTLRLRIDSDGIKPIWSEPIPFELHRPMQGRVTWVTVTRKFVANREVWAVCFTCNDATEHCDRVSSGTIAVDVSWRKISGSMRIGFAQDTTGQVRELTLGPRWIEANDRADRIRSHRDEAKNLLVASDARFSRCKSCRGVARKARELVMAGEVLGPDVEAWLRRDRHLWQYEDGCRRRVATHRSDQLRKWVRGLANSYKICVIKDTRHKKLKEAHGLPQAAARQGHIGAPGKTIEQIRQVFGREQVAVVSARHTTARCSCGVITDHGAERIVTCEQCGAEVDRDLQSTRNMLDAHARGDSRAPAARKTTARFAKRHKVSN
jgi:hypothetical protein